MHLANFVTQSINVAPRACSHCISSSSAPSWTSKQLRLIWNSISRVSWVWLTKTIHAQLQKDCLTSTAQLFVIRAKYCLWFVNVFASGTVPLALLFSKLFWKYCGLFQARTSSPISRRAHCSKWTWNLCSESLTTILNTTCCGVCWKRRRSVP